MRIRTTLTRGKQLLGAAVASLLTVLLVVTGMAAPASAADSPAFNLTLSGASESYDGTQVLTPGTEYTLAIQYFLDSLEPGQAVSITVPSGVTIPDAALVVPPGNDAITALERDGDGKLKLTFADPLPSVTEGALQLKFTVDSVEESTPVQLVWGFDGVPTTWDVIVKKPGDSFENVENWRNKGQSAPNLGRHISIDDDGNVVLSDDILNDEISYTLRYHTVEAADGLKIADVTDSLLAIDASSFAASLTTWDANGLNKSVDNDFDLGQQVAADGSGFEATVNLPAASELVITYKAKLKPSELAGLRDALQTEYEKIGEDGGDYSVGFANTVTWGDDTTNPSTASGTIGGRVSAPVGPNTGSAVSKSVDRRTVRDAAVENETPTGADLVEGDEFDLTYTLEVDLTVFADFADSERFKLGRNVVVRDYLPEQVALQLDTLRVVDADGDDVPLTFVATAPDNTETAMSGDAYLFHYTVSGQDLFINLGQDTTETYTVTFTVTVNDLLNSSPVSGLRETTYNVWNAAYFVYGEGRYDGKSARTQVIVPKDTSAGIDDPQVFTKSVTGETITVPSAPATAVIPFTFTVGAEKADLTHSKIYDRVDTGVFDISDLEAISNDIEVKLNWNEANVIGWDPSIPMTPEHWALEVNDAGELVFSFTDRFAEDLETVGWSTDVRAEITIPLPLQPVIGKQTVEITNDARLSGAKDDILYLSSAQVNATTYGDELEVRKTVYDAANDAFTNNLRVELDEEGELATDEFVYRIEVIPHGNYGTLGFSIRDIVDVLPQELTFLGFTDEASIDTDVPGIPVLSTDRIDLPGNLEAVKAEADGRDTVTIGQRDGTVLTATESMAIFFKVSLTGFEDGVAIINAVGPSSATITPTNDYPISIAKIDAEDEAVVITDRDARFTLTDHTGAVVSDAIYVVDGRLVVAGDDGDKALTVPEVGTYVLTEVVAPQGYQLSEEFLTIVVNDDGSSAALNFYNMPGETPTAKTYAIGDLVWIDADDNGLQDDDEILPGVRVELLDAETGEPVAGVEPQFTDANGRYLFDELAAGAYQVRFTLVAAEHIEKYAFTVNVDGEDSTDNSDGIVDPTDSTVAVTPVISLNDENTALDTGYTGRDFSATEGVDPTWDAGVVLKPEPELVSVSDYVWFDGDGDGIQGSDPERERPIPGVKLDIVDPDGRPVLDENGEPRTTVTNENGWYEFGNLPVIGEGESYTVRIVQNDPATRAALEGLEPTKHEQGADRGEDSSTWESSSVLPLTENGAHDPTLDFGFTPKKVSVGDYVWVDENRDGVQDASEPGIPNVKLEIVDEAGDPVTDVYGNPVEPQTTDENGEYSFDNLPAGKIYTVKIVRDDAGTQEALKPHVPTQENGTDDPEKDSSTWEAVSKELPNNGDRDPSLDFGFVSKTYAVGDVVWIDSNADGLQDESEFTLPGVTVVLTDADGNEVARTETDENGLYKFDNLGAGTYKIQFILTPAQAELYEFTTQDAGEDAADSDADPASGWTIEIVLDDSNAALTTDYPFGAIEATQGIDPTWDAGVVLKDLPVVPVDPTEPEPEQPVVPVGPPLGELEVTGAASSGSLLLMSGLGILLLLVGSVAVLAARRRAQA